MGSTTYSSRFLKARAIRWNSLGVMPAGVAFDTPEQIHALAARIHERAVVQRTMPPGNKTRITDAERAILARWIDSGAQLR